jgi:hypothetical protein
MGDRDDLVAIMAITELIMKYGLPAALQIITKWNVEEPTAEDWEALKVMSADEYFIRHNHEGG